jgi:cobalt-zinc-cadmium efflux system protein
MSHDHPHLHHHHDHAPKDFSFAFAVGIALNLGFVGVEAFYGWRVDSLALLADAGHNLSDVAGLVLAWAGAWAIKLRPNPRHTYGWQRATILAAFANAFLLLVAMGGLVWEAVGRLLAPSAVVSLPAQSETVMWVAGVGIAVNAITALMFMQKGKSDLNVRGAFVHMTADALVSLGVVVAGALSLWSGWTWLDPVVSVLIAAVILLSTWDLFNKSLHLLFDGVPHDIDPEAVRVYLASLEGVAEVHDLHIWAMSTSQVVLTAHLLVPNGQPNDAFFKSAHAHLHDAFDITHVTLQVTRTPVMDAC